MCFVLDNLVQFLLYQTIQQIDELSNYAIRIFFHSIIPIFIYNTVYIWKLRKDKIEKFFYGHCKKTHMKMSKPLSFNISVFTENTYVNYFIKIEVFWVYGLRVAYDVCHNMMKSLQKHGCKKRYKAKIRCQIILLR